MTNKTKFGTALATIALLGSAMVSPVSADFKFSIEGNGKGSDNEIDFDYDNNVSISQQNNTDIDNDVNLDLNTGNNEVHGTTGGDVSIETGDIDANVEIANYAGFNYASVNSCGSCGDFDLEISDNGAWSDNEIDVDYGNDVNVSQQNNTDIDNDVDVDANTGNNEVHGTTGGHYFPFFAKHDSDNDWKDYDHDKNHGFVKYHDNDYDHGKYAKFVKHDSDHDNDKDWKDHDWNDHDWYYDKGHDKFMSNNYKWCEAHEFDYDWWKKYHSYDHGWWNDHNGHDGGDVSIETGDVDANVSISNVAGFNYASVH